MNQPKNSQAVVWDKTDEVFRITVILRECGGYLSGESLLVRLLNGFEPTPERVRALYVYSVEHLGSDANKRVTEVCAQWLGSHGGLAVPEVERGFDNLFDEMRAHGEINQEDYDEIMNRKL